jgi:hypothetical protein
VQARVVALNREDPLATAVVEGMISISDKDARVLIDPGSSHSFIAFPFTCILRLDDKGIPCNVVVSTPLGKQLNSDSCFKDCEIRLGDVTLPGDLIRLPLEDYDIILGMDWLSRHYAGEDVLVFKGKNMKEGSCLISGVRARKLLYKRCTGYLAYLLNKPLEPQNIEEVPVVNEYMDVFLLN